MPDFLQLKQNPQVNNFRQAFFGDRRRTLKTLGFLVLILVIPLTVWLVQVTQIFSPRAASTAIELVSGGDCVVSTNPNQVDCATFPIRLISPLGPPEGDVTPSASPVQSSSPSASPSTSPAASASPQSSPSPSPSSVASPSPSVSPSPSPVNVAACVSSRLGISSPVATANVNGGSILYWRSPVSIDKLTSAASECGVQLLTPTNFTSSVLDTLVRSNAGGTIRSVWVAGPCSDAQVNAYRNAGIKVSADVQCNPPDVHLDYKVYPAANSLEGIGDFGPTGGDPAVFISNATASNFGSQLFSFLAEKLDSFRVVSKAEAQSQSNSIATCVGNALGLSGAVTSTNSKVSGTSLVYWNQSVSRANFLQKAADCGAEPLRSNNFNDADVKSLVQSVTGAPTSSSDATKYRSVLTQDICNSQKVQEYRDAGHTVLTDSQCDGGDVNLHFKVNQYYGPGSGANPFAIFSGVADGGDTGYPMVIVNTNASSTPSATSSVDPSSRTLKYRLAETEAGLASAQFKDYTSHPLLTNFTFSDATPGSKQIWVEFVSTTNQSRIEHITVELLGDGPVITSLDCSMDVSKQNLRLTVSGRNLGASGGKITANSKDAQVNSWNENQIAATIQPDGNLEQGRQFKVAVTTNENKILPEVICEVNTSLISLGARLFCRAPGKFDVNGVKVLLVDENGNKVEEVVTIDANGLIKGLKTRLQVGKPYVLSIKAENSLRKNIEFVAANGTNVVKPADDEVLILPVGDIAPAILPDGKINVPDRSELVRQWSVLGNGSPTGDFNRDSRVNSVDWACMRFDFNREDEGIPTRARGIPSGSLIPASSNSSSPASSALVQSPSPSMSPLPSGQRAGFFLLNPIEGGTYVNGDEFIVDVNIWSQIEAANLFVAKLSFDETALEVVRIEKGQTLTTWAEEFFNNQTGQISLVAGKPSPGLKTTSGQDVRLARIVFRSKKVGTSEIAVTNESRIFSNADNANILTSLLRTQIEIVNQ